MPSVTTSVANPDGSITVTTVTTLPNGKTLTSEITTTPDQGGISTNAAGIGGGD